MVSMAEPPVRWPIRHRRLGTHGRRSLDQPGRRRYRIQLHPPLRAAVRSGAWSNRRHRRGAVGGMDLGRGAVSMVVAQPIWGAVADRYGRKPMLIRSMIGGAVVIGLMGFAQTPLQLLVLRFMQGGVTGVVAAATALVSATTPKHRLGLVLGLMQVAMFTARPSARWSAASSPTHSAIARPSSLRAMLLFPDFPRSSSSASGSCVRRARRA